MCFIHGTSKVLRVSQGGRFAANVVRTDFRSRLKVEILSNVQSTAWGFVQQACFNKKHIISCVQFVTKTPPKASFHGTRQDSLQDLVQLFDADGDSQEASSATSKVRSRVCCQERQTLPSMSRRFFQLKLELKKAFQPLMFPWGAPKRGLF